MEIFSDNAGWSMIFRWLHVVVGVLWIGLLYYFNMVQVPSFAEMEAAARNNALDKLAWRALFWFRWAAASTFGTGIIILGLQQDPNGFSPDYWGTPAGTSILTGMLFATTMFANVWMYIWPNQRIVIENVRRTTAGGEADPDAPAAGRRALIASRTNYVFSVPVIFFMVFTSAYASRYSTDSNLVLYWIIVLVIWAVIEANAIGVLGGFGPSPVRKPLETVRNAMIAGVVLWAILLLLWEILLSG